MWCCIYKNILILTTHLCSFFLSFFPPFQVENFCYNLNRRVTTKRRSVFPTVTANCPSCGATTCGSWTPTPTSPSSGRRVCGSGTTTRSSTESITDPTPAAAGQNGLLCLHLVGEPLDSGGGLCHRLPPNAL